MPKKITIDGVEYPSHRAAAKALGVTPQAIGLRADPEKRRRLKQKYPKKYITKSQDPSRTASLDQETWNSILSAIEAGQPNNAIAKQFGVHQTTVRYIRLHRIRTRSRGERARAAKLTEEKVREIRAIYAEGTMTMKVLAEQYGVTFQAISEIVRRKSWKHVD